MAFRSVFPEEGQWFKGNLHMHTTLSDGRVSPSEAIERYRKNGYDFIAITDHRCPGITVEPGEDGYFGAETVEAGNMLLLSGVEWDTGGANTDLPEKPSSKAAGNHRHDPQGRRHSHSCASVLVGHGPCCSP